MTLRRILHLGRDNRGAALIEFAILAPVMIMTMMGLSDALYQLFAKSILNGAIQKVSRDATIQGGASQSATFDQKVATAMGTLMTTPTASCATPAPAGTYCATRKSYATFADVGPEPFTDLNSDGIRQVGECYTDVNGNSQWDADPGSTGQGGANDVALYTMSITYKRVFPIDAFVPGLGSTVTISTTTLLKNQPYATQPSSSPATVCT